MRAPSDSESARQQGGVQQKVQDEDEEANDAEGDEEEQGEWHDVGVQEDASLAAAGKDVAQAECVSPGSPSSPSSQGSPSAPSNESQRTTWTWQTLEVPEYQTLTLGPFEAGVTCEILSGWYGVPGDKTHQVDCTHHFRNAYSASKGLTVTSYNMVFGDPAPLRMKKACVEYRLGNVRSWDVSKTSFADGSVSKLTMMPVMAIKAITNMLGVTAAATGYAVGKTLTTVQNTILPADGENGRQVADSTFFQYGFGAWLRCNGIVPSLTYAELPDHYDFAPSDMKQTPIIVCNHNSYIDGLVLASAMGAPKIIAKAGTLNVPVLGVFASELGVIEVDRADPNSRAATIKAIQDHVEDWRPGKRPLLLFPEGTTSNGESLLEFKKGAFVPGVPVRPAVLHYTGSWHPANTNYRVGEKGELQATGDGEWVQQFLGHVMHSVQIHVLPPYEPSEAEIADPMLFANGVRHVMSDAHSQLRTESHRRQEEAAQQSITAYARRSLDLFEDVTSRVVQGAREAATSLVPPMPTWRSSRPPSADAFRRQTARRSTASNSSSGAALAYDSKARSHGQRSSIARGQRGSTRRSHSEAAVRERREAEVSAF
eukprot:TRINITY_DN23640_c0_g1_i2.p1 TRINITY_DN23640_c0_g1~~TRINITY_DN23640_c0_g1_i2.p1  ORF type:complete len:609 (-),score=108.02 TRINITY_DN23640_c0_g1_i2:375-2168(-)